MKDRLNYLFTVKGTIRPSTYLKFLFFFQCAWLLHTAPFQSGSTFFSILYFFMVFGYFVYTLRFLSGQNKNTWLIFVYIIIPLVPLAIALWAYFTSEYKNIRFDRPMSITLIAYLLFFTAEMQLIHLIISPSLVLFIQFLLSVIAGIGLLNKINLARILVLLFLAQQVFISIHAGYSLESQSIQSIIMIIILFFLFRKKSNLYFAKK